MRPLERAVPSWKQPRSVARISGFAVSVVAAWFQLSLAAQEAAVDEVAGLLARVDTARARDCLELVVRREAMSGGVALPALFQHPRSPGVPAVVAFDLDLPGCAPSDTLLFAFSVGLADGITGGQGEDGVIGRSGESRGSCACDRPCARAAAWRCLRSV
jgi:hypothetical protein